VVARTRSSSQASRPDSRERFSPIRYAFQPPCRRYRFTVFFDMRSSFAILRDPQPRAFNRPMAVTSSGTSMHSPHATFPWGFVLKLSISIESLPRPRVGQFSCRQGVSLCCRLTYRKNHSLDYYHF